MPSRLLSRAACLWLREACLTTSSTLATESNKSKTMSTLRTTNNLVLKCLTTLVWCVLIKRRFLILIVALPTVDRREAYRGWFLLLVRFADNSFSFSIAGAQKGDSGAPWIVEIGRAHV